MHQAWPQSYPTNAGFATSLESVHEEVARQARPTFLVLFGATLLVLVLACANAANLLVTQQLQRRKELTVRIAVGSSRARIVQMLVVESVLLTLISGALGLSLAYSALGTLSQLVSRFSQRASEISIDGGVLAFALGVSILTGIGVGLLPALSIASMSSSAAGRTRTLARRPLWPCVRSRPPTLRLSRCRCSAAARSRRTMMSDRKASSS